VIGEFEVFGFQFPVGNRAAATIVRGLKAKAKATDNRKRTTGSGTP
jgi:hypothetical protein